MTTPHTTSNVSTRRLLGATLGAFVTAVIVLIVAVLPVEYGVDPIGAGRALGLLREPEPTTVIAPPAVGGGLAPATVGPTTYFAAPFATDRAVFEIGPYDYVEYKYRLEQGASVTFSWEATRPVGHELHADPDGTDGHNPVSFDKRELAKASGTHTAPFAGMHGWFWENLGGTPVTVTVSSAGFYTSAMEYRPNKRQIPHPIGNK
jgi:hypothetical protein